MFDIIDSVNVMLNKHKVIWIKTSCTVNDLIALIDVLRSLYTYVDISLDNTDNNKRIMLDCYDYGCK